MQHGDSEKPDTGQPAGGLGTFGGVFTPSVLTILGIILFLRLGYVVGNAGLFKALIIIGIAFSRPESSKRVIGRILRIKPEPDEQYRT